MIDITNPAEPQLMGGVDTPDWATDVAVAGTIVYVADSQSGIQVIDVTYASSAQLVGSVFTPGAAYGAAVSGAYVYVADCEEGLQVVAAQCEETDVDENGVNGVAAAAQIRILPNPSASLTTIHLELRSGGPVEASIHDPAGRRVRSLSAEILSAGPHDLIWDGRDDDSREVAGGVYLIRVSSPGVTVAERVVVLRQSACMQEVLSRPIDDPLDRKGETSMKILLVTIGTWRRAPGPDSTRHRRASRADQSRIT